MTLDRTTTPPVGTFPPLSLPAPGIHALSNGIEIIACNRGDEDVCRIDLMFEGGYYTEQKPGTAALTLLMLKEGAAGKSSEEIAESFDYHGAWLQTSASSHYLYVTLYTLNRHLDTCLSLLADIVIRPDFPEKEFTRLKERRLQQLLVQKEKVDVLASETFLSMIFGDKHPYGRAVTPDHINHITTEDLRDYHRQHIAPGKCRIFIAGKITGKLLDNLELHFGHTWNVPSVDSAIIPAFPIHRTENPIIVTHKENALQSGIRMGLPVIGRENPDFFALKLHYTRRIFRQQTHVQHTGRKGLYLWHIFLYRRHAIRKLFNHIDPNRNRIHPPAHRRSLRRNRSTQKRARPDRRVHHRTKLPERRHGSYPRLPLFHSGLLPFIESQRSPSRIFCAARRSHTATVTRRSTIGSTKISRPLTILHSRRRRQEQNSPALPTLTNSFSSTTPPIVTRHPNATGGQRR